MVADAIVAHMSEKKQKLSLFSGSDWYFRGGRLLVVAKSVTDAARLIELARRATRGYAPDKMAEPVDKIDVSRNSRWINEYFGKDENFRSSYAQKVMRERGVWHAKEDWNGMAVEELVRLV